MALRHEDVLLPTGHPDVAGAVLSLIGPDQLSFTDPEVGQRNGTNTLHIMSPAQAGGIENLPPIGLDFMLTRFKFVEAMGWLPGAVDDIDHYDMHPGTQFVLSSNPENPDQLFTGMRLTSIESPQESLTWGMLASNPAMQKAARRDQVTMRSLSKAAENGELFDLTRLVVSMEPGLMSRDQLNRSALDMFGAGLVASETNFTPTREHARPNPAWLFLTGKSFLEYLNKLGIETREITRGMVHDTDTEESTLCVAYPEAALGYAQLLADTHDTYRQVSERVTGARESFDTSAVSF